VGTGGWGLAQPCLSNSGGPSGPPVRGGGGNGNRAPRRGGVWPNNETLGLPGGLNAQPLGSLRDLFGLLPNLGCGDFVGCGTLAGTWSDSFVAATGGAGTANNPYSFYVLVVAAAIRAANNGTRLERLKNCALGYYGIDPLSVSGATSNGAKWALIALSAGGIPKSFAANLGLRVIMQPGASEYTSALSMLSLATGGGGALRTIANFGSKWAVPIAIGSAVIDAAAIGICTISD
jgi:hypothetical protein